MPGTFFARQIPYTWYLSCKERFYSRCTFTTARQPSSQADGWQVAT